MERRRPSNSYTFLALILQSLVSHSAIIDSHTGTVEGCSDGTMEGFSTHPRLAACSGSWHGHIRNSSSLCAEGWSVCNWKDVDLLRTVAWSQATSVGGCYAYNAAHDKGQCKECVEDINQDDMAGIGKGCPHQNFGQNSCLANGRIDASCCIDSVTREACTFIPGVISGVLCCKPEETVPRIIVSTQGQVLTNIGSKMMLECHATGKPTAEVIWYRNGHLITNKSKNIKLTPELGMLEVLKVRKSDAGIYKCVAANVAGSDHQVMNVTVAKQKRVTNNKGCHDGIVEGLHHLADISACEGIWSGHVRHGKTLCAVGWHVCSAKDNLKQITWEDATNLKGCFAYDAASNGGQCNRCSVKEGFTKMAGVGKDCQEKRKRQSSCLIQGRIDVLKEQTRYEHGSCKHQSGITTGVLCCKTYPAKRKKSKPSCHSECQNGGMCGEDNRCHCAPGFKGVACQNAICDPKCSTFGTCIKPGVCKCQQGYRGSRCELKDLQLFCLNGGKRVEGKCVCPLHYKGKHCQHKTTKILLWRLNRTSKERHNHSR
ncbi:uncharacterized protein [Ptychodera flava]|uniref:uncharacterized protein isoform X1 n=1 Tax=Ptychodera flava TaxID=63121 RepID=UPI00396A96E8